MSKHELCTYFDSGYLPRALVLHESLKATGLDFRLTALCLDEESLRHVDGLGDPTLHAVSLSALEANDPELLQVKPNRSVHEYYFTLGPSLLRYVLDELDAPHVTYLDADMRFYLSPETLFDESRSASVVIVGHRFPDRLRHLEETGTFNVAWVGFSADAEGRACLEWWRARCLEWCADRVEPERYADQKYLDQFPARFDGVHVLAHPGADVAPWNVADPPLTFHEGRFTVGGEPLVFFHFQGFRQHGRVIDPHLAAYGNHATAAVRRLYRSYAAEVAHHGARPLLSPRRPTPHGGLLRRAATVFSGVVRRRLILCRHR